MSYIALYRKYRPRKFAEVVSQDHVKTTLLNALSKSKVAHAYLFCGPRGVGKTTIGRLLAHAVNCENINKHQGEPCGKCDSCKQVESGKTIDLIEIDAASNRGIDEIRELKEKVKYTPTNLKYLVFIIDEVHMLTIEAFNALLKTLEEPPAHAIFVLATTDPQKVPPTILSRCQRFDFKRISRSELVEHLTGIVKKEKIKIAPEALEVIAGQADGSSRDALSILGQVAVAYEGQNITADNLRTLLGLTNVEQINDFILTVLQGDLAQSLRLVNDFINDGYAPHQLAEDILNGLRRVLLICSVERLTDSFEIDLSDKELADWQSKLADVSPRTVIKLINLVLAAKHNQKYAQIPQLPLEMAVISFLDLDDNVGEKETDGSGRNTANKTTAQKTTNSDNKISIIDKKEAKKSLTKSIQGDGGNGKAVSLAVLHQRWPNILNKIQAKNFSLGSLLKSSRPDKIEDNKLVLVCQYEFHREFVQKKENQLVIENCLRQECEAEVGVHCVVGPVTAEGNGNGRTKSLASSESTAANSSDGNLVKDALNILGGEVTN
ncbi:DNA polymerase III subunit gamma/tau [Patescibacteria group bacterium]|nr:DNA polymerase III subunit gamma/tau [Patescibacteria group bacterium]